MERTRFLKNNKKQIDFIPDKLYYTTSNNDIIKIHGGMFNSRVTLNYYDGIKGTIICENGITDIGDGAFRDYNNLTTIILLNTITSIGSAAFYNCSNLTSITCNSVTPPKIYSSDTFHGVDKNIIVYVPNESIDDYKNTDYWNEFVNIQSIN